MRLNGEESAYARSGKTFGYSICEKTRRRNVGEDQLSWHQTGGLGGTVTALAVNVNTYPTHIAGLPVAVNICCHVNRHTVCVL